MNSGEIVALINFDFANCRATIRRVSEGPGHSLRPSLTRRVANKVKNSVEFSYASSSDKGRESAKTNSQPKEIQT